MPYVNSVISVNSVKCFNSVNCVNSVNSVNNVNNVNNVNSVNCVNCVNSVNSGNSVSSYSAVLPPSLRDLAALVTSYWLRHLFHSILSLKALFTFKSSSASSKYEKVNDYFEKLRASAGAWPRWRAGESCYQTLDIKATNELLGNGRKLNFADGPASNWNLTFDLRLI